MVPQNPRPPRLPPGPRSADRVREVFCETKRGVSKQNPIPYNNPYYNQKLSILAKAADNPNTRNVSLCSKAFGTPAYYKIGDRREKLTETWISDVRVSCIPRSESREALCPSTTLLSGEQEDTASTMMVHVPKHRIFKCYRENGT